MLSYGSYAVLYGIDIDKAWCVWDASGERVLSMMGAARRLCSEYVDGMSPPLYIGCKPTYEQIIQNFRGRGMTGSGGTLIVSGRWDDNVAIVDIEKALLPENDKTPNAVISRPRVTPDLDLDDDGLADARASGQPVAVTVDAAGRFAYVVCHSGDAEPDAAKAYQHGHPGLVTVLDIAKAIDPANDDSLEAVVDFVSTGRTGPVGCAITPDGKSLLVNCGEAAGSEDGGDEVTVIDVASHSVTARVPLALNADHPATSPSSYDSPHPSFGHYPNPTGIAISPLSGGIVFVGNGGFSDVSVLNLDAALSGSPDSEINRIPVETGPFGLAVSPDGKWVAVAARESMSHPYEGGTVSIIDVVRAAAGRDDAETLVYYILKKEILVL